MPLSCRFYRWSVVFAFLLFSTSPVGAVVPDTWTTGPTLTGTVVSVYDGDTFKMRLSDGETRTIRLIGVDTPETYRDNTPGEFGMDNTESARHCLRRFGRSAKRWMMNRIQGKTVQIHYDRILGRTGYYGRTLGYVEYRGSFLNQDLLKNGYARLYESDFMGNQWFHELEQNAQSRSKNLWTCGRN